MPLLHSNSLALEADDNVPMRYSDLRWVIKMYSQQSNFAISNLVIEEREIQILLSPTIFIFHLIDFP